MEIVDKSGEPRSDEDLKEALTQVEVVILKQILKLPPNLMVHMTTIREALMELIMRRKEQEINYEKKRTDTIT